MILNIAAYQFTKIAVPELLATELHAVADSQALRGTILIASEGLNLFLAGSDAGIETFVDALSGDPRFADIVIKRSRSLSQPFARLKVKVKSEIISFRQPDATPLAGRARALAPAELARWIAQGKDDQGNRLSCSIRAISRKSPTERSAVR